MGARTLLTTEGSQRWQARHEVQELGGQQDSNARTLVYALRPYLKPERQEKVERALQLARLFHLGKKFLAGWEGS